MDLRTELESLAKQQDVIALRVQNLKVGMTPGSQEETGLAKAVTQTADAALSLKKVALRIGIADADRVITAETAKRAALQTQLQGL